MDWDYDSACYAVGKWIRILIERVCCAVGIGIGISIGRVLFYRYKLSVYAML